MKKKCPMLLAVLLCCFIMGCNKDTEVQNYTKGEEISFGTALGSEQKEELKWIVLECEEGEVLLLSKEIVDYRSFHSKTRTDIEWHNSDICLWLNNDFYNDVFSEAEKDKILTSEIKTKNYGSNTAAPSTNQVFLLDIDGVKEHLSDKEYAKVFIESDKDGWLLRDKAENQSHIAYVNKKGEPIESRGVEMNTLQGIRPAIRIKSE